MTAFTVTFPDGTTDTRNSKRPYTHAVVVHGLTSWSATTPKWHVLSYATSETLAVKSAMAWSTKMADCDHARDWSPIVVLPVTA